MKRILFAMLCIVSALGMRAQGWTAQEPADGDFYLYNVGTGTYLSCGEAWGTQAVVGNGALKFTLANNGSGAYTLFTTSTFSYGNPNTAQLQSSGYVDQSVNATTWTFTAVNGMENTFTLLNAAGKYLTAPSEGSIIVTMSDELPTNNYGYWKLINLDHLFDNASKDNPVDVTCLIGDANFESSKTSELGWTMNAGNKNLCGGDSPNKCAESYRSTFTLSQVLNDVPNGEYELTAQGFYRQDGSDNEHLPVFYINEKTGTFPLKTGTENSMGAASTSFTNGLYTIEPIHVTVGDGKITLGAKLEGNTMLWCIWDNFTLKYLGVDLTAYENQIASLRETLNGLSDKPMNSTVKTSVETALSETASVSQNQSAMEEAIAQLTAAIEAANTSIDNYAVAKAYLDKSSTLDDAGKAAYAANETVAAVQAAYDNASLEALTGEQKTAMDAAIIVATKAQTTVGSDWTLVIVNPSFENGFASGWTNGGMDIQNNTSFPKDGNNYCEKWQPNGTVKVSQELSAMPAGVYRLTVKAKTRGITSAKVFAGGIEVATKIADEVNTYAVEFACDANANVMIGFEGTGTGAGASWIALDDFHLTLVSAGLPDVTAVEGKMNAEVAAAQTAAIAAYNNEKTIANYNAAQAAIANAEASIAAYTVAKNAVDKAKALKEAHNFASEAATTTFTTAITNIEGAYNDGTLTDADANAAGTTLGVVVTGWHGGNNNAAPVYLRDGFSLPETFAADPALHVNTWSTEGDTDGTGFSVPFYESWTPDANSLPESTLTGTLTDLPNGLYKISAWVRVAAKTGVNAAEATGITMNVNNGTAVDVTEGEVIGSTQRSIATYEAEGLVKQGELTLNFNIAADANISWFAFKNVKYTKVRDLTPEEAFVAATEEDYAALNTAIANAEAKTLGFDEGEYAPYNNVEALAALTAAKAIDQNAENAQEDVQAATTALTGATWNANATEVNAFYDGTFANAENNGAPKGWRMSNNTLGGSYHSRAFNPDESNRLSEFNETNSGLFLRFDGTNSSRGSMYYYGDTENYTMPLKAETWYYVKVDFAGWGSTGKPLRMNVTGPEGFTAKNQQFNTSVRADNADNTPQQFLIVFQTTTAGNYVINFQTPGADSNTHNVVISNCELFRADEVTMSIKANKYGTFIAPFDVTIPADVKAYGISEMNGTEVVLAEVETTIPANTPVVVENTTAEAVSENFYGKNIATEDSYTTGYLTGVYTTTKIPVGAYVLQTQNDKQAFYKVESTGFTATPNRAYLTVPAAQSGVKAFYLGGDATGINGLINDLQNGDIYDLTGRKVQRMQKGNVYIVNGKKVVVK